MSERALKVTSGADIVPLPYRSRRLVEVKSIHQPALSMVPPRQTVSYGSLRKNALISLAAVLLLVGATGGLLAGTTITGAVVTSGLLVVKTGPKKVQHETGGIVSAVHVEDGDQVTAGQILIDLDNTAAKASLRSTETNLVQQEARLARLLAERDDKTTIVFDYSTPTPTLEQSDKQAIFDSETRQFLLRKEQRDNQRSQLSKQAEQAREEVKGNEAQLAAINDELKIVEDELAGLKGLFAKKLVPYARVSEIDRDGAQLRATKGGLEASIAAGQGKIAEIELAIMQVDQTLRSGLTDEIAAAQSQISQLAQQQVVSTESLRRTEIRAPQSGVVHELAVRGPGAVVQAGETVMVVVPQTDALVGEVRIRPSDIDQVYPSQPARIQFSAFDRGTTPTLNGTLQSVSPDLEQDQRTGAMYYSGRIEIGSQELEKLKNLTLVPGMPIEVFITTGDRTILSYLTKPLSDQVERAFR